MKNAVRSIVITISMLLVAACATDSGYQQSEDYGDGQYSEESQYGGRDDRYRGDPRQQQQRPPQQRRRPPQEAYARDRYDAYEDDGYERRQFGGEREGRGGPAFVGALLPRQTPAVDRLIGTRNADEYGPELWQMVKNREAKLVNAPIKLFLYNNGQKDVVYEGQSARNEVIEIDSSRVRPRTALCVEVPWEIIAHQRKAAERRVMCTNGLYEYIQRGGARTRNDAFSVVATAPGNAGMNQRRE